MPPPSARRSTYWPLPPDAAIVSSMFTGNNFVRTFYLLSRISRYFRCY
jgi:hypothetical protein